MCCDMLSCYDLVWVWVWVCTDCVHSLFENFEWWDDNSWWENWEDGVFWPNAAWIGTPCWSNTDTY